MLKMLFLLFCFFASSVFVNAQQYPSRIRDCKKFIPGSGVVNNNYTTSDGVSGADIYVEFKRCSYEGGSAGYHQVCLNNAPGASCPKTGCQWSIDMAQSKIGWSFDDDCDGDGNTTLHVGTIECRGCGAPNPTPTPGTVDGTGGICAFPMQNFTEGACPYGYTSDSTGYYCCQTSSCTIDPNSEICTEQRNECETNGGLWKGCCRGCFSPIVIDVAGNGFNLTDGNNGVMLDVTGDGTKDKVSWTAPFSDDAWLALDRNRNGTIDNALELFGNFTDQPPTIPVKDRNGFLALAVFDQPQNGGNGDGKINRQDLVYNDLRLWQDANHNGISEPNELHPLNELDVKAVFLDYKESKRRDQFNNRFKYRARVRDSRDADVGKWAWDVFLLRGN